MFAVLEDCTDARSIDDLRRRLLPSLATNFRVQHTTFFTGDTLTGAFADLDAEHLGGTREKKLLVEYQDRWREVDVYGCPQAVDSLNRTGVSALHELRLIPAERRTYVEDFMRPRGLAGSAALRLSLPAGRVGLVGMFDRDSKRIGFETCRELRLLSRHLSTIGRLLPPGHRRSLIDDLCARHQTIAQLVAQGLANADIAGRLFLAEDTVKKYVSQILAITGCRSRTELALRVQQTA